MTLFLLLCLDPTGVCRADRLARHPIRFVRVVLLRAVVSGGDGSVASVAKPAMLLPDTARITDALRHEIDRRTKESLQASLADPRPETMIMAEMGLADWARRLPADEISDLVYLSQGQPIRWEAGRGWVEEKERIFAAEALCLSTSARPWGMNKRGSAQR